jgi:predicted porin
MQRKVIVAAILASLPLFAAAQSSVTIYGVADVALAKENTGAANGGRTAINSGNQSSSRFGFRGTEDIGGGLKAVFNLEGGYAIDSGLGDASLFGRRSVVGLEGEFGSVILGREYTPIADVANATDILGQGFYGSNLSAFASGKLTRRISNSVNYKSPVMSGFKFSAAYSAGEATTGPSLNLMGVAADYKMGNLYIGAGYHTFKRLATGDDKELMIGAAYKMGAFEIKGNYMEADPTGATNKFEQINLGLSYTQDANKFFVNYQTNELETGAKGNSLSLAYSYTLSKRTNLYTSYAKMRNNSKGVFGLQAAGTAVAPTATQLGADPSAFTVGLRHSF